MAQIHPQTETAVANEALSFLLLPGITDLDTETSQKATVLRRHFAATRDAMQRQYPWNFCERYTKLNALPTVTPPFRFRYAYALPNNPYCLAARQLHGAERHEWKISNGRQLFANVGPCIKLVFTALVDDVSQWDALFRNAFGLALASRCGELCKDQEIVAGVAQRADAALKAAWPVDAEEGTPDALSEQDIIAVRF